MASPGSPEMETRTLIVPTRLAVVVLMLSLMISEATASNDCSINVTTLADQGLVGGTSQFGSLAVDPIASEYILVLDGGITNMAPAAFIYQLSKNLSTTDLTWSEQKNLSYTSIVPYVISSGNQDGILLSQLRIPSTSANPTHGDICISRDGLSLGLMINSQQTVYMVRRTSTSMEWKDAYVDNMGLGSPGFRADGPKGTAGFNTPFGCSFTPDDLGMVMTDSGSPGHLRIVLRDNTSVPWSTAVVKTIYSFSVEEPGGVAVSPDGLYVMVTDRRTSTGGVGSKVYVIERNSTEDLEWNTVSGAHQLLSSQIESDRYTRDVKISHNGLFVAVTIRNNGQVLIWSRPNTTVPWSQVDESSVINIWDSSSLDSASVDGNVDTAAFLDAWGLAFLDFEDGDTDLLVTEWGEHTHVSNLRLVDDICCDCTCGLGFEGEGGNCTTCPAGKYKDHQKDTQCSECPGGGGSPPGSTSMEDCEQVCQPGYTHIPGGCTECPEGTFKSSSGSAPCTNCSAGTYSNSTAATDNSTCMQCPPDSNSLSGSSAIDRCICNIGHSGPDGGLCEACEAGTFKWANGSTQCESCSPGKYGTAVGAVAGYVCLNCTANSNSPAGSTNVTDCTCNPGFGGSSGVVCSACPAGKYKGENETQCTDCPGNSSSPFASTALVSCVCDVGFSGPHDGPCLPCQAGKYKNSSGSLGCTACLNSTTSIPGSISVSACVCKPGYAGTGGFVGCSPCSPGYVSGSTGMSVCEACPFGSYQDAEGGTACESCPTKSNSSSASTSIFNCSCFRGYELTDGAVCTACTRGKYKNTTGTQQCLDCPEGQASAVASDSVDDCGADRICQPGDEVYSPQIPVSNLGTVTTLMRSSLSWVKTGHLMSSSFQPRDVTLSKTGEYAIIASDDNQLYILNRTSSSREWAQSTVQVVNLSTTTTLQPMLYIALSPDSLTLAISSGTRVTTLHRNNTAVSWATAQISTLVSGVQVFGLDFGHDGSLLFCSNSTNSTVDSSVSNIVNNTGAFIEIFYPKANTWASGPASEHALKVVGLPEMQPMDVAASSDGLFFAFIDGNVHGVSVVSRTSTSMSWTSASVLRLISNGNGYINGLVEAARLSSPTYLTVTLDDLSILISDTGNNAVRMISRTLTSSSWTDGEVLTLAGGPDSAGSASSDGSQTSAVLNQTKGLAADSNLKVMVVDDILLRLLNDTMSGCVPCPSDSLIPRSEYYISGSCDYRCSAGSRDVQDPLGGPNFCELDALPVDQIFEGNANLIRMRLYHYENMFDAYIKPYLRDQLDGFLLDNALVTRNGVYGRCWNSLAALGETICFDIRSSSEQCIEQ